MLPQVLDVPGSYQEFTATCMLGYALARDCLFTSCLQYNRPNVSQGYLLTEEGDAMATLVTGGTGFVGSNIVRTLARRCHAQEVFLSLICHRN